MFDLLSTTLSSIEVLQTRVKRVYIGTTCNLYRRLKEHNSNNHHFTGKIDGEWKIIFKREFNTETEARKEEIRFKKAKNKKYIKWYIENMGR